MKKLEEVLARVAFERDSVREEAMLHATTAGTLPRELETQKTDLEEACQLASSWKEKAEGNFRHRMASLFIFPFISV